MVPMPRDFGLCFCSQPGGYAISQAQRGMARGSRGPSSRGENPSQPRGGSALGDRDPTIWVKMSSMSQSRNVRLSVSSMICAVNAVNGTIVA